jgi:hypothetical protein
VSVEVTEVVPHAQPSAQENAYQEILIFRKQFHFVVSGLKIIGQGNPDNNLESHCTMSASATWQMLVTSAVKFPSEDEDSGDVCETVFYT